MGFHSLHHSRDTCHRVSVSGQHNMFVQNHSWERCDRRQQPQDAISHRLFLRGDEHSVRAFSVSFPLHAQVLLLDEACELPRRLFPP